jgi:membrane dipeptidase
MPDIDKIRQHALELHRRAVVIDAHSDLLMPIADSKTRLGEELSLPDPAGWQPPIGLIESLGPDMQGFSAHTQYFGVMGQFSIPQFKRGGVTVQVCGIYLENRHLQRALERGLDMVWCFHREIEDNPDFELVTTVDDIRRVKRDGKVGGVLALEGLDVLGFDGRYLDLYYKLGLRIACLTHNRRNMFADGPVPGVKTGGLTAMGRQAVKRMEELGIVVDLAHSNLVAYEEVLDMATKPVIVSHRSPRNYFPRRPEDSAFHPATDVSRGRERLEALAKNGGVLGVIFFGAKTIDDLAAEIEYVIDTVGPDHVGYGADFYGIDTSPKGLEDVSKYPLLTEALVRRGHSDEVILKILGENFIRVFEQVWR